MSGNPASRMWRKHRLKKQYQKRAREAVKTGAAGAAKKTAAATEKAGAKAVGFVKRHPVGVVLALACVLLLFMMQSCSSSLVMLGNSGAGAVGATTYPSQDEEMLARRRLMWEWRRSSRITWTATKAPTTMTSTTSTWTVLSTIPMC